MGGSQSSSNLLSDDAIAKQMWVVGGTEGQCQRDVSRSIYKVATDGTTDDDMKEIIAKEVADGSCVGIKCRHTTKTWAPKLPPP